MGGCVENAQVLFSDIAESFNLFKELQSKKHKQAEYTWSVAAERAI